MDKKSIRTTLSPDVVIERVGGNLKIKGWENPEVAIYAAPEQLILQEQDDLITLSCQGDCAIRMPYGTTVRLGHVAGSASIKLLEDELIIGEIDGSLSLRNIQGDCAIQQVQGDLDLHDVEGSIQAKVGGDAQLHWRGQPGKETKVSAGGNLDCHIPASTNLNLKLSSGAEDIKINMSGRAQSFKQRETQLTLGRGDALMQLSAGGALFLESQEAVREQSEEQDAGFEQGFAGSSVDFSQQITQQVEAQIEAQMEVMNRQLEQQMQVISERIDQAGLSPERTERIIQQARQKNEQAASHAQEKMRRAQEKLERKLEAMQRQQKYRTQAAERQTRTGGKGGWSFNWTAPPTPSRSEPVSDEERLAILRMLEQKKITLEQADMLLSALEEKQS